MWSGFTSLALFRFIDWQTGFVCNLTTGMTGMTGIKHIFLPSSPLFHCYTTFQRQDMSANPLIRRMIYSVLFLWWLLPPIYPGQLAACDLVLLTRSFLSSLLSSFSLLFFSSYSSSSSSILISSIHISRAHSLTNIHLCLNQSSIIRPAYHLL